MATTSSKLPTGRRGLVLQGVWRRLITVLAIGLALLALAMLGGALNAYCQRQAVVALFGEPVAVRLTADLAGAGAQPLTAWAINTDGQIGLLVVRGADLAEVQRLPGPYIPGRDGRYVVPWLRAVDADGDGDGDLVLNIAGELFVYLYGSDGTLHYATEAEQALLRPAAEIWP
jgi:hypothetical protein